MIKKIIITLPFFVLFLCGPFNQAYAQKGFSAGPWNLALVLDFSPAMDQLWGDISRKKALKRLLETELRSLPLRVSCGVWGAWEKGEFSLVKPQKAQDLRELELVFPKSTAKANLDSAILKAKKWLATKKRGTLLIITCSNGGYFSDTISHFGSNYFCQVISLGPCQNDLKLLAAKAGGGCFQVLKASMLNRVFRQALRSSITDTRLKISAHDLQNNPLTVPFNLKRRKISAHYKGYTGRPIQLLNGVYQLIWPNKNKIGPLKPMKNVSVAPLGLTQINVGGQGSLKVIAKDPGSEKAKWGVKITRPLDGQVIETWRRLPYSKKLPAGEYLVSSRKAKLYWRVLIDPGAKMELTVGPLAKIKVNVKTPLGKKRLAYELVGTKGVIRKIKSHTGYFLPVPPGSYFLKIKTVPPLEKLLSLMPDESKEIEIKPLGGVLVKENDNKPGFTYAILDSTGEYLTKGKIGKILILLPGKYFLKIENSESHIPINVKSGEVLKIKP